MWYLNHLYIEGALQLTINL